MLEYVVCLLILLSAYFYYNRVLRLRKKMTKYASAFRSHGFKVKEFNFKPFGAPFFQSYIQTAQLKGDAAYYFKHDYHRYDLIVSNVLDRPIIIAMNPELIKEITSAEKIMITPKVMGIY